MLQKLRPLIAVAFFVTSAFTIGTATANINRLRSEIVGSWYAVTAGAPYDDHVMQFDDSGNVLINNPSRVQEQADGNGTNDSIGVGSWKYDHGKYVFTFMELNAVQGTNIVAPQTEIRFVVTFGSDGLWSGPWSGGGHTGTIHAVRKITV